MKNITYTSTLPKDTFEKLDKMSSDMSVAKNKLIDDALNAFFIAKRKKDLARDYARAAKDPEMIEMAEWGMADYLKMIEEYEGKT